MPVTVETLEKLERKITLKLPAQALSAEVEARLRKLARSVRMDGFRPGKVPFNVVAQRYGASVHYEVLNDQVGQAFQQAASEAQLRVAGAPRINAAENPTEGEFAFDAVFEVFPQVQLTDLSAVAIEKISAQVSEEAIDKTVEILRKQRRSFAQRVQDAVVADGDRVTVDFDGKIDGESFAGGKAEDFQFIVGEGRMLKEFEEAVLGMQTGRSKTFQLPFPPDYHGQEVAGKTADFMVTVKRIEAAHLPEVNEAFAKSLGLADATVAGLRADVRKNLEREVKLRLIARNKQAVLDALLASATLDCPKTSVQSEVERMVQAARAELKARGIKDAEKAPIPEEGFRPQAERRVRLGLVVAEIVRSNSLHAKPEQVRAHIEEIAGSYEKPAEVARWYYSDPERLAQAEAVVVENNLTEFVLSKAKVSEKQVAFDELMSE